MRYKQSPGQLSLFGQVLYFDRKFDVLKDAMKAAFFDFYAYGKYPVKIEAGGNVYRFREMKKFWDIHGFYELYY